jgi:hypothetical protein
MMNKEESLKWLWRTEEYRSNKNDIGEIVEDFDDMNKLGNRFVSSDELEEVDIGEGSIKQPTYMNANLTEVQNREMLKLLRKFADFFAWSYAKMPGLNKGLVEHRLPIKKGF